MMRLFVFIPSNKKYVACKTKKTKKYKNQTGQNKN